MKYKMIYYTAEEVCEECGHTILNSQKFTQISENLSFLLCDAFSILLSKKIDVELGIISFYFESDFLFDLIKDHFYTDETEEVYMPIFDEKNCDTIPIIAHKTIDIFQIRKR